MSILSTNEVISKIEALKEWESLAAEAAAPVQLKAVPCTSRQTELQETSQPPTGGGMST